MYEPIEIIICNRCGNRFPDALQIQTAAPGNWRSYLNGLAIAAGWDRTDDEHLCPACIALIASQKPKRKRGTKS